MAELTASTGMNEPGSIYSYLQGAVSTGLGIYGAVTGKKLAANSGPQVSTAQPPAGPAKPSWQKYLPWAIGGAGVLVLLWLFTRKS